MRCEHCGWDDAGGDQPARDESGLARCPACWRLVMEAPTGKVMARAYLHSCKESMCDLGQEIGLSSEALNRFVYALREVELEFEVDAETGECEIVKVDGRPLGARP